MNNLLSKRKIWKSPVTPFNRLSLSGRDDEDYYDDYYYDDEVDRDDKDVSARSRAEVGLYIKPNPMQEFFENFHLYFHCHPGNILFFAGFWC